MWTISRLLPSGSQRSTAPVSGLKSFLPSFVVTLKPAVADREVELAVRPHAEAVQVVAEELHVGRRSRSTSDFFTSALLSPFVSFSRYRSGMQVK